MQALILAAGRGSRMGNETAEKPKCLTEILGHTLLSLQCRALRAAGVQRIGIVTGYRRECLSDSGLELLENDRWASTNMVMSLVCGAEWLKSGPCIVSYSDIFYFPATVRRLIACQDELAITYDPAWQSLWEQRFADPLSDAETFKIDADGWITEIGKRAASLSEIAGQYMGLLRFTPKSWAAVETYLASLPAAVQDKHDMTSLLMQLITRGQAIRGVAINEPWGEVDAASDRDLYEKLGRNGTISFD